MNQLVPKHGIPCSVHRSLFLAKRAVAELETFELVVFGVEEPVTGLALSDADVGDEIPEPTPSQRRRPLAHDHVHAVHRQQRLTTHHDRLKLGTP